MTLRKGHCYTQVERAYTRKSKVKSKSYIKTIPPNKVAKYTMGDMSGYNDKKYKFEVSLVIKEDLQMRDNALEAARQQIHRHLEEKLKTNYFFILRAYPHHILREHRMLTGAGADRMSSGMAHSFGQAIGVAAQIKKNSRLFSIFCQEHTVAAARTILNDIRTKIPGVKTIIVEKVN